MVQISIDDNFRNSCPAFKGAGLHAKFTNSAFSEGLWKEISLVTENCRKAFTTESIKDIPAISSTRSAYRTFGKDPSRYRPSGESLIRRILQGKPLYQINAAVDLINLASIEYGYSIGGFDLCKIRGKKVALGIGEAGEPYEGIGRGKLNIENLPVYRDAAGGIGTPTSDNERTKLSLGTTELLALVNGYDGDDANIRRCAERIEELLYKYANCTCCRIFTY